MRGELWVVHIVASIGVVHSERNVLVEERPSIVLPFPWDGAVGHLLPTMDSVASCQYIDCHRWHVVSSAPWKERRSREQNAVAGLPLHACDLGRGRIPVGVLPRPRAVCPLLAPFLNPHALEALPALGRVRACAGTEPTLTRADGAQFVHGRDVPGRRSAVQVAELGDVAFAGAGLPVDIVVVESDARP